MTAPERAGPCAAEVADMVKRLLKLDEDSAVSTNHKGPHAIYGHAAALLESIQRERDALQARVAEAEADCVRRQQQKVEFFQRAEKAEAELAAARKDAERAKQDKDGAYLERNHLVAALSKLYPSGIRYTNILGWSPDWHGCCMIELPSGQISYHFHDSHAHLFAHLKPYAGEWDGHDKDDVHARLSAIDAALAAKGEK